MQTQSIATRLFILIMLALPIKGFCVQDSIPPTLAALPGAVDQQAQQVEKQVQQVEKEVQKAEKEIQELKSVQEHFLQTRLDERITKIVNTPDFVRAANTSICAISLSNSLADYLNDVSSLNNPANGDLGFSLSQKVEGMMERHIFKNKKKNGFARVMEVSKSIIEHPLVSTLTSALPIVSSLGSVVDLVSNVAIQDPSVPIADVNSFRDEMSKYVTHYQGLADATSKFQLRITTVQERAETLQVFLKNFAVQRIANILPGQETGANKAENLRKILVEVYEKEKVVKAVEATVAKYKQGDEVSQEKALTDPALVYPDFVVHEARFFYDEMVAISKEYVAAFNDYQADLMVILEKSKAFGDAEKINAKITAMKLKLDKVEATFLNAVHVEEVESRFKALVRTQVNPAN